MFRISHHFTGNLILISRANLLHLLEQIKNIILLKQIMVTKQMMMMKNGGTCNPITGDKTQKFSDLSSLGFGSLFCSKCGKVQMFPQHFWSLIKSNLCER